MIQLDPQTPASTRPTNSQNNVGARAEKMKSSPSPKIASSSSGRRPKRSDRLPIKGAKANCARLKAANIQPPITAARSMPTCPTSRISAGRTGMISPKPTMSRNTVISTKPTAWRDTGTGAPEGSGAGKGTTVAVMDGSYSRPLPLSNGTTRPRMTGFVTGLAGAAMTPSRSSETC